MSSFRASITVIGIVFLMVTLGVIIPITRIGDGVNQEGFTILSPGMYPKSLDQPVLSDTYKVKQNPGHDICRAPAGALQISVNTVVQITLGIGEGQQMGFVVHPGFVWDFMMLPNQKLLRLPLFQMVFLV